jgi:hypothetical protein
VNFFRNRFAVAAILGGFWRARTEYAARSRFMTHTINILGYLFQFESTRTQRQFAGRTMCIAAAIPIVAVAFAPALLAFEGVFR